MTIKRVSKGEKRGVWMAGCDRAVRKGERRGRCHVQRERHKEETFIMCVTKSLHSNGTTFHNNRSSSNRNARNALIGTHSIKRSGEKEKEEEKKKSRCCCCSP